jgi:hypothetical protein
VWVRVIKRRNGMGSRAWLIFCLFCKISRPLSVNLFLVALFKLSSKMPLELNEVFEDIEKKFEWQFLSSGKFLKLRLRSAKSSKIIRQLEEILKIKIHLLRKIWPLHSAYFPVPDFCNLPIQTFTLSSGIRSHKSSCVRVLFQPRDANLKQKPNKIHPTECRFGNQKTTKGYTRAKPGKNTPSGDGCP